MRGFVLLDELDLSEIAVLFLVRARGEIEDVLLPGSRPVAEPDTPEAVDRDRVPALAQLAGVVPMPGRVLAVRVDPAVAEVADQQAAAETAEVRRRLREPQGEFNWPREATCATRWPSVSNSRTNPLPCPATSSTPSFLA